MTMAKLGIIQKKIRHLLGSSSALILKKNAGKQTKEHFQNKKNTVRLH